MPGAGNNPMTKTNVLHVVVRLSIGGIEKWLTDVLQIYDRSAFQMDVCCVGLRPDLGELANKAVEAGSRVHYLSVRNPFRFILGLAKLRREYKYDALMCHVYPNLPIILAGLFAGFKNNIIMYHNTRPGKALEKRLLLQQPALLDKLSHHLAKRVLGCSRTTLHNIDPEWCNHKKFKPLLYGIPLERFANINSREIIKKELNIPLSSPIIGHVGRFDLQKNHTFFIETARVLNKYLPDAHFVLVGDGPLRCHIETLTNEYGLSSKFHFLGIQQDVPSYMSAMDIAFYPSHHEGSPITFMEAQAAGLPVVTGNRPELFEAICPQNHTYANINLNDPNSAANHILMLLNQPRLRHEMSLRGAQWARQTYAIQHSAHCLEAIFSECILTSEKTVPDVKKSTT
jgi:glycosyltransferase EpsF